MSSELDPDLPLDGKRSKLFTQKKGGMSLKRVTGGGGDPVPARRPRDRLQTRGGDLGRVVELEEYQR